MRDLSSFHHIETLCAQAGYDPASGDPRVPPIVQSTTFYYDRAEQLADLFDLKAEGCFYSRLGNPTCEVLEKKVAALEGGVGAIALSSGQAATLLTVLNVCGAGDHVVCSQAVYGGTFNLLDVTLKKLGIEVTFVPAQASQAEIEAAVRPETRLLFGETIANPAVEVLNFEAFAGAAKKFGILFAVDNTLATPVNCRPLEWGADLVTHSSSKYLDGHAVALGGIIVDGGRFDFSGNPRYPEFNRPDESYHGLVYSRDCGNKAFLVKARGQLLRDLGTTMSPMNAFLTELGTETLHLRMERTNRNALAVAEFLAGHPEVEFVRYPFLKGENAALAKKYLTGGGGMISFGLKGGRERAARFIAALKLFANVTHVADLRSSVIHPASTTHRQMSEEALEKAGIRPNQIRLSLGIEHEEDLIADLKQAIERA